MEGCGRKDSVFSFNELLFRLRMTVSQDEGRGFLSDDVTYHKIAILLLVACTFVVLYFRSQLQKVWESEVE